MAFENAFETSMQFPDRSSKASTIPIFMVSHNLFDFLPSALGLIESYSKVYKNGALNERLQFIPLSDCSLEDALQVGEENGQGIWLFSNYVWNIRQSLQISKAIKDRDERNITIHGGPDVPMREQQCFEFLLKNRHVDIAVRGEGEIVSSELFEYFISSGLKGNEVFKGLEEIKGISSLDKINNERMIRSPDRPRIQNLDVIPSPYLNGVFDSAYYQNEEQGKKYNAVTLQTNRGCPYQCTFCDWGSLTQEKIKTFELDRIKEEIKWLAKRKLESLLISDANFGILSQDLEIAQYLAETKKRYGYPREISINFTKNGSKRVIDIHKILSEAGLSYPPILSIQTRDEETLKVVKRENIKNVHYDELLESIQREQLPINTEIIFGLPGSTLESLKRDIQYYYDRNVNVRIYRARLLINSPMADPNYMERYKIKADEDNAIITTYSFTEKDHRRMVLLAHLQTLFVNYSLLKYLLRYLQWEHKISITSFLELFISEISDEASSLLQFSRLLVKIPEVHTQYIIAIQNKGRFFEEIKFFLNEALGLPINSSLDLVLRVNCSVTPAEKEVYPKKIEFKYDFAQYYLDAINNNVEPKRRLEDYSSGTLNVSDPYEISAKITQGNLNLFHHATLFELSSPLSIELYNT